MSAKVRNVMLVTVAFMIAAFLPANAAAAAVDLPDGAKLDLSVPCPVCGMKPEESKLGPAAVVLTRGQQGATWLTA